MLNYYYRESIEAFQNKSTEEIIGAITMANQFDSTMNQNKSWEQQIPILKNALNGYNGSIFFEFSILRYICSKISFLGFSIFRILSN